MLHGHVCVMQFEYVICLREKSTVFRRLSQGCTICILLEETVSKAIPRALLSIFLRISKVKSNSIPFFFITQFKEEKEVNIPSTYLSLFLQTGLLATISHVTWKFQIRFYVRSHWSQWLLQWLRLCRLPTA